MYLSRKNKLLARTRGISGSVRQRRGDWARAATGFEAATKRHKNDAELHFKAGNAFFRAGADAEALVMLRRAVDLDPGHHNWWYRLGFVLERAGEYEQAISCYDEAERHSASLGVLSYRRGRCFRELGDTDAARKHYLQAIAHGHEAKAAYQAIAQMENEATPLWQRAALRRQGQSEFEVNERWTLENARFAARMGNNSEASCLFRWIDDESPLSDSDRFVYARCLEESGRPEEGQEQLRRLVKSLPREDRAFGIAAVFQSRGWWTRARQELENMQMPWNLSAERMYRIGMTYDREYRWERAAEYFEAALTLDPRNAYWSYKCGHATERSGQFLEAASWYLAALEMDPSKRYWWYRAAAALSKADQHELAAQAAAKYLGLDEIAPADYASEDPSSSSLSLADLTDSTKLRQRQAASLVSSNRGALRYRARAAARAGLIADATDLLERIMASSRGLRKAERIDVAEQFLALGNPRAASSVLLEERTFQLPDGIDPGKYLKTEASRRSTTYAEYSVTRPVNPKVVLFESNHGASIGCHPLALYREMTTDPRFEDSVFVWAIKKGVGIPVEVESEPRVVIVEPHSDEYLFHLATAGYLVNNVSFAPYFVRRATQRYLNTWHGTPMKTLGRSMKQGIIEYENLERNFLQATHIMAPNELTRWALIDEHHLDGIYPGATMITGSPRLDRMVGDDGTMRTEIRSRVGVSPSEKLVFVAPTWRGGVSARNLDRDALVHELRALSEIPNSRVFYRAHRLTEALVRELELPVEVVPSDLDTNDFLSAVDHLVTDYSSVAFDFLPTGRPATLYVPDEAEYMESRGLYITPDELPFGVARTLGELVQDVSSPVLNETQYRNARDLYAPLEDGKAAQRCIDFLLSDDRRGCELNGKPTYVFHASMIPNGIASSARALFQQLVKNDTNVVLIVEPKVLRQQEARYEQLKRLPSEVKLVSRVGGLVLTPEESYVRAGIEGARFSPGDAMMGIYESIWIREGQRLLGEMPVAAAVEWDGYAGLWANILARVGGPDTVHAIWQHNDMRLERTQKFPSLDRVFAAYRRYDRIASVSSSLGELNAEYLKGDLGIETPLVSVVHNTVPVTEIEKLADEPLDEDIEEFLAGCEGFILNIGRNSPEKNQVALIQAWKKIQQSHPGWRMIIAGGGPLAPELAAEVDRLGLSASLMLAGQRNNVLPLMKRADLFVLPSLHEGQPVVLFEAMSLGTPVLASDLPGNIEAMREGYGETIGTTPGAIAEGIHEWIIRGESAENSFLRDEYAQKTFREFVALIA